MQQFQKGAFQPYRALTKIHFGKAGVDVFKDDVIEFDGFTVRISGQDYVDPAVRGAISAGWFVPEADNVSQYIAKRADIKLRPSLNAGAKADQDLAVSEMADEEREVSTLDAAKAKRTAAATSPQQRTATAQEPEAQQDQIAALQAQIAALQAQLAGKQAAPAVSVTKADDYSDVSTYSDTSGQDAVPVSRIKTPSIQNFKTDEATMSKAAQALQADGKPLNIEHLNKKASKNVRLSPDSATGDVLEAREALDVEDLLPDAAKGKPKGKVGIVNTEGEDNAPATVVFITKSDGTKMPWDKGLHWRIRTRSLLDNHLNDKATLDAILAIEDKAVVKEFKRMAKID